jgi:uracil-DNA glycosylase
MIKVAFIGDRPSTANSSPDIAFVGTKSHTRLLRWISEANVSNYELHNAYDVSGNELPLPKAEMYVALGAAASKRLAKANLLHLALPHPSGRNRLLNDSVQEQLAISTLKLFAGELGAKR